MGNKTCEGRELPAIPINLVLSQDGQCGVNLVVAKLWGIDLILKWATVSRNEFFITTTSRRLHTYK